MTTVNKDLIRQISQSANIAIPQGVLDAEAAGAGDHGGMSCCALGNDMKDHAEKADSLILQYNGAVERGDIAEAMKLIMALVDELTALGDASNRYLMRCGGKSLEEWCGK